MLRGHFKGLHGNQVQGFLPEKEGKFVPKGIASYLSVQHFKGNFNFLSSHFFPLDEILSS